MSSYEDVKAWIEVGNRQRATASTGMNDKSSRSHSVFTLNLVQTTVRISSFSFFKLGLTKALKLCTTFRCCYCAYFNFLW